MDELSDILEIHSISGIGTTILFKPLKIMFDIGKIIEKSASYGTVFISHGHMDHIGALNLHLAHRNLFACKETVYIVPASIRENVVKLIDQYRAIDKSTLKCSVQTVHNKYSVGNKHYVTTFKTIHKVPSQGYILWESKQILKPELRAKMDTGQLTGEQISAMRKNGKTVTMSCDTPEFCFTGDTIFSGLSDENIFTSKILIMEMTFLCSAVSPDEARKRGHTHLSDFCANIDKFKNEKIIFTHFSSRYTKQEIQWYIYRGLTTSLQGKKIYERVYIGFEGQITLAQNFEIYFDHKTPIFDFLSNFYRHAPFTDSTGRLWASSEHYYQAHKFTGNLEFAVFELQEKVRTAKTPFLASFMTNRGELAKHVDFTYWTEHRKIDVMREALKLKFTQNENILRQLLETGKLILREYSETDQFWAGEKNMMGTLLMELRTELK